MLIEGCGAWRINLADNRASDGEPILVDLHCGCGSNGIQEQQCSNHACAHHARLMGFDGTLH